MIPGNVYERELKNLLSGDNTTINKISKTCDEKEKIMYSTLIKNPFLMIRAAGSLGVDLVALRWDYSFPIEVKSSSENVIHFSNQRMLEQANRMLNECRSSHLLPIYAFRLKNKKGDPWRIFVLPVNYDLKGNMGLLQRKIPAIDVNENGNYIMRWNNGMKLSEFIQYINY